MDSLLSKAGNFLFAKRAEQELSSLGDDVNVCIETPLLMNSMCENLLIFQTNSEKQRKI